jgi:hypothetical protein
MSKLTFAALRNANASRAPRWHTSEAGMNEWTIGDWFMAMAGEVGEGADELLPLMFMGFVGKLGALGNMAKKYRRVQEGIANKASDPQRQITAQNAISKMFEELADVQIYLDLLALRLREAVHTDEDIGDHVEAKFNKTSELYGFPERIIDGEFVLIDDSVKQLASDMGIRSTQLAEDIHRSKYGERTIEGGARLDRMETQGAEFDKVRDLIEAYRGLPPIVDDDYPEARHYYERAVRELIAAFEANGRMQEDEPEPEDFSRMTFSVDVEFSQHLDINHGDRLKVHIKDGKAVGVEVKEKTPAAMIVTEQNERRTGFAEQAREDVIAVIFAPKERGSEIDPPEDYDRLLTISIENMTFKPPTLAKLIRKALRNRFKDYRFKTEEIA